MAGKAIPQMKQMAMGIKPAKTGPSGVGTAGIKPAGSMMKTISSTKTSPGMRSAAPTGKGAKIK